MQCFNCHVENPKNSKYCKECGSRFDIVCPKCNSSNPSRFNFCGECGHQLNMHLVNTPLAPLNDALDSESERKNVTILFSDISGYTAMTEKLDPEEVKDIMGRIFGEIAQVVTRYGGFIEKFIGDAIVAFFGVPNVHEDDPVRGIMAARKIHGLVEGISPTLEEKINTPIYMHTGINTGLVVTGEVNFKKGIHGVVGEAVNLASRLSGIAKPNEILISNQTHKLVSPYFQTKPLGQVRLKGISRMVTPHLIVGELKVKTRFEAARNRGFSGFIGRHQEIDTLFACLEKTIAGNGQLVTISGEAGVGKSRLIYEFRHSMDKKKITVLQGRCHSYGRNIPYWPFLNALKRGLSLREEGSDSQLEERAISHILAIDPLLEQYLPLYLHLFSIPSKNYPVPKHLHGEKFKNSIRQALADLFLFNAKGKPMVLILEDWHWVDGASDSILKHLAERMDHHRLMIVILHRPTPDLNWQDLPIHTLCLLKAMDVKNTGNIIKSIWEIDMPADEFVSFVHLRTGGNPFFIEEVCRALSEDGAVKIVNNKLVLVNPLGNLRLPDTVQAVIRARLDRLDNQSKKILKLAAVIGREFSLRILERISGNKPGLALSLDVLKAQELIHQTGVIPEVEYMFQHVLTQVAVYKSLLLKKRKEYHGLVGMALEQVYTGRLEEQCENLAHHYSNSSNLKKAVFYLEMAGNKATRVHSLSDARKYYETALSFFEGDKLDTENQQKYIDLTLGWAESSQYAPSNKIRRALERSLEYAKIFNQLNRIADVSYWVGKFAYMQGDFIEVILRVKQCIKWAQNEKYPLQLAASYNLFGRACLYTGDYSTGINYLNKGLKLITPFDRWDDVVYSMGILGVLLGLAGEYKKSLKTLASAIKIARKYGIPTFEAMLFGYFGSIQFWYGNWNASINNCRQCIKISRKLNNALPIIWASFFKGAALFSSSRQEEGLNIMKQSIQMMENMDSVLALRFFYSLLAENLAVYGMFDEAGATNEKAMAFNRSGQKWGEIGNHRTMGILAASGKNPDWNQVGMHMEKSIDLATQAGAMTELVKSLSCFSGLMLKKGDPTRTQVYFDKARNLAGKIGCLV